MPEPIPCPDLTVVAFSKDRPLQLHATLASLRATCLDPDRLRVRVLVYASDDAMAARYRRVAEELPWAELIGEDGFKETLLAASGGSPYLAFVVDDCLFVRPWRAAAATALLARAPEVLGVSLRLGRNATWCYALGRPQTVPPMLGVGDGWMALDWTRGDADFGYPLELSSSVYRAEDLRPLLEELPYRNPNELEAALAGRRGAFARRRPVLACAEHSLAFCAPLNVVQTTFANRAGTRADHSPEALGRRFDAGERVDVACLAGFTPRGCHEEIELPFARGAVLTGQAPAPVGPLRIGFLLIGTNRYTAFFPPLRASLRQHLAIPGAEPHFFFFTNLDVPEAAAPDTTVLHVDHLPWPLITLLRYKVFLDHAEALRGMDYLYYLDVDCLAVDRIGPELLGRLVATSHPGYHGKPRAAFTYEARPASRACVAPHEGARYYAGGLQGGEREAYLELARTAHAAICDDLARNVIAVWHDESHLNRYLIDHPPSVVLDPSYLYPESWQLPFPRRILALDKDHAAIRREGTPTPAPARAAQAVAP